MHPWLQVLSIYEKPSKILQLDIKKDLDMSSKKYKRLGPFKDEGEIWRVGIQMTEFTPFTLDQKPPALLPRDNYYA